MFRHALASLSMAVVLACSSGSAAWAWDQVPEGLVGRWVWTVEGRPTFLLDIAPDLAGKTSLTRPERVSFFRDGTISGAQGAVSVQPLSVEVESPDRLKLVRSEDGSTYGLELVATGAARLSLAEGIPSLALYRPYNSTAVLTDWGGDRTYRRELIVDQPASNPELAALYEADQAARQSSGPLGIEVATQDRARRARVHELMAQGDRQRPRLLPRRPDLPAWRRGKRLPAGPRLGHDRYSHG